MQLLKISIRLQTVAIHLLTAPASPGTDGTARCVPPRWIGAVAVNCALGDGGAPSMLILVSMSYRSAVSGFADERMNRHGRSRPVDRQTCFGNRPNDRDRHRAVKGTIAPVLQAPPARVLARFRTGDLERQWTPPRSRFEAKPRRVFCFSELASLRRRTDRTYPATADR